ncbi:MAG: ArsR/SmtB family transcription factor [Alphaproteobacteria bacterium]
MEQNQAIDALAALAHDHRMQAFRLLVRAGPAGLAAGEIAGRMGIAPSSLSFHLSQLAQAGLIGSRREARYVYYAVDFAAVRGLLAFLTEDCCLGLPGLVEPEMPGTDCCPPEPTVSEPATPETALTETEGEIR